jgi:hypothetical protein
MSYEWAVGAMSLGNIISGFLNSRAAESAADKQVTAARQAGNEYAARYNTARTDLAPYLARGRDALSALQQFSPMLTPERMAEITKRFPEWDPSKVEDTAGYKFTLQQGLRGVDQSALARGAGGNALRGAAQFSTNLASQTYGQRYKEYLEGMDANLRQNLGLYQMLLGGDTAEFNRLLGQAQLGSGATVQLGQLGVNTGQLTGNALQSAGTADAAGTVGSATAIGNAAQNIGNNALLYQYLQSLPKNPAPKVPDPPPLQMYYTVGNELTGRGGGDWLGDAGVAYDRNYYRSAA